MSRNATRRTRRAAMAALAVCAALGASNFVPNGEASTTPLPPPPVGAVLETHPDLVVSATTPTTIRVANVGSRAAGPFSISVSSGYIGDACGWSVSAVTRGISGLTVGQTTTVTVPESSTSRTATVDSLKQVPESNESNNTGTVLGARIVC
jgi:hypothetical protein